ncbi:MAG: hypothetical protein PUD15_08705 [Prevotella sp.]|nr:hypothetical protein [Prevotella sp.]
MVDGSKKLCDILDGIIQDSEMDYINDKLMCFCDGAVAYSIAFFERSWMMVRDADLFVEGVRNSCDNYGLSEKSENLLKYTEKLKGTNLFNSYANKLCNLYFKEEIKTTLDWVEGCSKELYAETVGEKSSQYIEELQFNQFGDYLWDEDAETFYIPQKVSA